MVIGPVAALAENDDGASDEGLEPADTATAAPTPA
jgi:hypothetical protein